MKYADLHADLRRRGPAPIYWVTGEEDYLRDQAVTLIRRAALAGQGSGQESEAAREESSTLDAFNDVVLYGDETDGAEILAAAREAPMFVSRRLVVVKVAEKLPARETETLLSYLGTPCDSTTLIFTSHKLDGRQKFPQTLKEKAVVVDCAPLPDYQAQVWIRAEAERLGIRINEDAVALLKDLAGSSLYLVQQELDKLAAYVPPNTVAGVAEVEVIRGGFPGASVFDLTEAISVGDRGRALHILTRNVEAGEAPLRILGSLVWQYRRIWKATELLAEGRSDGELARMLGVPPYRLRDVLTQAKRFSAGHLKMAFNLFLKADSDLKGGSAGTAVRVLEALLLDLCADLALACRSAAAQPTAPRPVKPGGTPISNVRTVRSGRTPAR
jgi:DNA polymerase III subunit delta